jgi:hypothetical protein
MAQCESKVFFPDDPAKLPQFNDCPRRAETTRCTRRFSGTSNGEPKVITSVVKPCSNYSKIWDC